MMHTVNLFLWLAMVGVTLGSVPDGTARWTAVAGLIVAACWQHAAYRGFLKPKNTRGPGVHDREAATGIAPAGRGPSHV